MNLNNVDSLLYKISKDISLSEIAPINLKEEKKCFFKDNKYNPEFEYNKINSSYSEYLDELSSLKFEDDLLSGLYKDKVSEMINHIKMFNNKGKKAFTNFSIKKYGQPSKELLSEARKILSKSSTRINTPAASISTKFAINKFKKVLDKLNFKWEVSAEDIVPNALVNPTKRKLIIKKDYKFTNRQLNRFIAHEIYTHVLRAECSMIQPYKLFLIGLKDYIATEEGLAMYKEKKAGVLDERILKGYAGRVLAIDIALKKGFRQTYNFLRKFYSRDQSWDLTLRVKRGLTDTSKAGAFTKDLIYLKGYLQVNNFIKNPSTLRLLHYGKIGIEHVVKIPLIPGLKDPDAVVKNIYKVKSSQFKNLCW